MPWTGLHWTVVALLCICAVLLLGWIHAHDRADRAEAALRGQPTRRTRKYWRRTRLTLPKAVVNRRRE